MRRSTAARRVAGPPVGSVRLRPPLTSSHFSDTTRAATQGRKGLVGSDGEVGSRMIRVGAVQAVWCHARRRDQIVTGPSPQGRMVPVDITRPPPRLRRGTTPEDLRGTIASRSGSTRQTTDLSDVLEPERGRAAERAFRVHRGGVRGRLVAI